MICRFQPGIECFYAEDLNIISFNDNVLISVWTNDAKLWKLCPMFLHFASEAILLSAAITNSFEWVMVVNIRHDYSVLPIFYLRYARFNVVKKGCIYNVTDLEPSDISTCFSLRVFYPCNSLCSFLEIPSVFFYTKVLLRLRF